MTNKRKGRENRDEREGGGGEKGREPKSRRDLSAMRCAGSKGGTANIQGGGGPTEEATLGVNMFKFE